MRNFSKGLHLGIAPRAYQLNETPHCWNIDFYPEGTISKRTGYSLKHTGSMDGSGSPVTWLEQFFTSQGADYLIGFTAVSAGCDSGSVYHWNSATDSWTHMGSSIQGSAWTPEYTDPIKTETFADHIIAMNSTSDNPIYWDASGASWETIPASFAAGYTYQATKDSLGAAISAMVPCKAIKGYKNYLFIANTVEGGVTYNSRVRWSDLEDPFAWPSSNYIDLDPNDGDYIVAMEILGDNLIIFKERKIYSISYIGGIYVFDSELKVEGRGCTSPQSITSIYNDLIFAAEDGIYAFTGHDIEDTSYKIKDAIVDINPTNRDIIQSAPLEEKNQLWFIAPSGASNTCNVAFVYDYDQECWSINSMDLSSLGFYYITDDLTMADLDDVWDAYTQAWDERFSLANTSVLIVGTYDGKVGDSGYSSSDGGSDIVGIYRTPWLDMGEPRLTKRLMRITFFVRDEGTAGYNLTWRLRTDYDDLQTPVESGELSLSGGHAGYMIEKRIDITQQAKSFQLEFRTDQKNEPWRVYEVHVDYTMKGSPSVDSEKA